MKSFFEAVGFTVACFALAITVTASGSYLADRWHEASWEDSAAAPEPAPIVEPWPEEDVTPDAGAGPGWRAWWDGERWTKTERWDEAPSPPATRWIIPLPRGTRVIPLRKGQPAPQTYPPPSWAEPVEEVSPIVPTPLDDEPAV